MKTRPLSYIEYSVVFLLFIFHSLISSCWIRIRVLMGLNWASLSRWVKGLGGRVQYST